jgi:phospholipase/carboxylesterase
LGLTNGDLFTYVLAFSPGFMAPAAQVGSPRVFISHGTRDEVLPIDRCSRKIVSQLRRVGYDARYREFEGGHGVPPDVGREAVGWFAAEQGVKDIPH